jgi:hypothetical protein
MNLEQAKEILYRTHLAAIDSGVRAHGYVLESGPGIGKTDSIFQLAERLSRTLNEPVGIVVSMIAELTGPDMRGFMLPVRGENGAVPRTVFTCPPWMPAADNIYVVHIDKKNQAVWHDPSLHGVWEGDIPEIGMLFLDEWGQGDEDVRKPGASLIHKGLVGTYALPSRWRVVAAQNRTSDRSGVQRELMHIVGRRFLLGIDPDLATWLNWADDQTAGLRPHHLTRAFARKQSDIVFRPTLPDSPEPYASPRTLCMMDRDIRVLRTEDDIEHDRLPMSDLARELCASVIGKASAAQFFTHLRFADELPDLADILDEPTKAKVPSGKDAQMICAYMLADVIDDDTAKPVFRYVRRLATEMQVLNVAVITGKSDVNNTAASMAQVRRTKALVVLPEYQDWLMQHKDTLLASQM